MKPLGELKVQDYMAPQTVMVGADETLSSAIRLMDDHRLSMVPVSDDEGNLVGVLSNSDLIEYTHELQADINALRHAGESTRRFLVKLLVDQGDSIRVTDVMTTPVESVSENANLIVAAKRMIDRRFHHLPVVDEAGNPVGMLAASDFVRAVADYGALLTGP